MKRKMTETHKFLDVWLFSFKKLNVKDKLIIIIFTCAGYRPTATVANDQWEKGNLTLVHDANEGWYQYDKATQKAWDL